MAELDSKTVQDIRSYLREQVDTSLTQRDGHLRQLRILQKYYEAKPDKAIKTFPWKYACGVRSPLTSTNVEAIFARIMNSIFGIEPYWTSRPLVGGKDAFDESKRVEYFMYFVAEHVLKMFSHCSRFFMGSVKYGTAFEYLTYQRKYHTRFARGSEGRVVMREKIFEGPILEYIPIYNMLYPVGILDVQNMPWIGHQFRLPRWQVEEWKKDKILRHTNRTMKLDAQAPTEHEREQYLRMGLDAEQLVGQIGFYQLWFRFDADKDGYWEPMRAFACPEADWEICAIDAHPYDHGFWPYGSIRYMPREDQFEGIGVIEMLQHVQETIDTIVRQGIDNHTLANTRWYTVKRGIGLPQTLSIWPGRMLPVSDHEDIKERQLGDPIVGSLQAAEFMQGLGERRTGVTEYSLGRESPLAKYSGTATATMALLQEATRRFDLCLKTIRDNSTEAGYQIIQLYQQFLEGSSYSYFLQQFPAQLQQGLEGLIESERSIAEPPQQSEIENEHYVTLNPDTNYRERLVLELAASRASLNREIEKQNYLALFQMLMGFYDRVLQAAMQFDNPQVQQMPTFRDALLKVSACANELTERVIKGFDIRDAATLIPAIFEVHNELGAFASGMLPPGNVAPSPLAFGAGLPPGSAGGPGPIGGGAPNPIGGPAGPAPPA